MKSFYLVLLLALISLSSSNPIEDKIKCLIENENIKKGIMTIIDSFKSKEDIAVIISKIILQYNLVKDDIKQCLEGEQNEPVLKAGCRYEEQFKECQKNSCDYIDEYTCMEYCYRKYC